MENQIEYQRNVIKEEYISDKEINERLENIKSERAYPFLHRGEPPGIKRMEKKVAGRVPFNGPSAKKVDVRLLFE
jgi:hypothetical protein